MVDWDARFVVEDECDRAVADSRHDGETELLLDTLHFQGRQRAKIGIQFSEQKFNQIYATLFKRFQDENGPPITRLFGTESRRQIIRLALDYMNQGSYGTRPGEIADRVDVSRESVRQNMPLLRHYRIIEVNDPDANIPHYHLADSPPVKLLQSWGGIPLTQFFGGDHQGGLHKLVEFFFYEASPEQWYLKSDMIEESDANQDAIENNIQVLVDNGLVRTKNHPEERTDILYQINQHSSLRAFIFELNESLRQEYTPWVPDT